MEAQDKVSDFGFVDDDFGFIVISFLILYLFYQNQYTPLHVARHKDVASVLLAHNANVVAQNVVSDFGFGNDDFVFIVISFLIMHLFLTGSMDSLTCCLCEWPQRCSFNIVGPQCECGGSECGK